MAVSSGALGLEAAAVVGSVADEDGAAALHDLAPSAPIYRLPE
jgi:hypothetical protein